MPKRTMTSLTAEAEARLLRAIALRLPAFVFPDLLTGLAVFGAVLVFAGYAASRFNPLWLLLSCFGFVVHWFGDSLDGSLARARQIERPRYGMFLDQCADLVGVSLMLLGMGLTPWIRLDVALFALVAYLLLVILSHFKATATGLYDIAHGQMGGTEGRLLLIGLTLAMLFTQPMGWVGALGRWTAFDAILLVIAAWGVTMAAIGLAGIVRHLARVEPPRHRTPPSKTTL